MRGTAGLGFSSQEQVDVRGGFSPSCCSTTPIQQQLGKFIQFGSEKQKKIIDYFNKINSTSCISQNRSELIHLQYFSFEFYLKFTAFQIQRKPTFIYPIKLQSLQDLQHISAIEQIAEYVLRSNFNQEFCNSRLEGMLKIPVLQYNDNDTLYSVCATMFVQISVTEKILSTVSLFFEVNESPSSSIQQLDRDLSIRQSFPKLSNCFFQIGLFFSKKDHI